MTFVLPKGVLKLLQGPAQIASQCDDEHLLTHVSQHGFCWQLLCTKNVSLFCFAAQFHNFDEKLG